MQTLKIYSSFLIISLLFSCANLPYGKKIKDPFSGNAYQSNNRYWRASGKGSSRDEQVAVKKARLAAKAELASQVNSIVKSMADQYLGSTEVENKAEITGKFQDLIRQTVNTEIADLRMMDEEKYFSDEGNYTVFTAYEIKKRSMLKHMKKQYKLKAKSESYKDKIIEQFLDDQIEKSED